MCLCPLEDARQCRIVTICGNHSKTNMPVFTDNTRGLDCAIRLQHTQGMKTAILPQVRVEPQLRADLESVLREGETLSDFLESTVRKAVDYRRMRAEFDARADAAWVRYQQTGVSVPAEDVVAQMRGSLEVRKRELQGKHRPAAA